MNLSKRALAGAACAAALGALGLAWWLEGETAGTRTTPVAGMNMSSARDSTSAFAAGSATPQATLRSNGVMTDDPFFTPDLRHRLEAMILEAGEASDPVTLKQRLLALVVKHFTPAYAARASALVERYVDYRVALGQIKPPADASDPRALRAALDARQRVREKHFSPEEYDAVFAQEAELDRFTVARMEIERNAALTPEQKLAAVREAERDMSDAQRALRAGAVEHVTLAAQTAAFDARGASDQERYAQRRAQYGDAAAQQLAQNDREDRDWNARLGEYASAQANGASAAQLQALRQRLFTEPEQLRVGAAIESRKISTASR